MSFKPKIEGELETLYRELIDDEVKSVMQFRIYSQEFAFFLNA
jgi:hypothetical protein